MDNLSELLFKCSILIKTLLVLNEPSSKRPSTLYTLVVVFYIYRHKRFIKFIKWKKMKNKDREIYQTYFKHVNKVSF